MNSVTAWQPPQQVHRLSEGLHKQPTLPSHSATAARARSANSWKIFGRPRHVISPSDPQTVRAPFSVDLSWRPPVRCGPALPDLERPPGTVHLNTNTAASSPQTVRPHTVPLTPPSRPLSTLLIYWSGQYGWAIRTTGDWSLDSILCCVF